MIEKHNKVSTDLGLFTLRMVVGGLLAGHGAQKLFGSFGGYGLKGTAGWLESMGMRPGKTWAVLAGGSEFGSGIMMALGLLGPVGPISAFAPMIMAWRKAHAGKPIWATSGGAELPLMYMSAASAIALSGPGRFSLDKLLKIKVPVPLVALTAVGVAAGVAVGLTRGEEPAVVASGEEVQVGQEAIEALSQDEALAAEAGVADFGGIGQNISPQDVELAAEVGADPPGPAGLDMRGASHPPIDDTV